MNVDEQGPSTANRPTQPRSDWVVLALLAGLGLYLSWRILQPFATVILWSLVLALMFGPLNRKLVARTGRRNLAAAITLTVAVLSVLLPLAVVSLAVAGEIGDLVDEAPARWAQWSEDPRLKVNLSTWRADLAERFPIVKRLDAAKVQESLTQAAELVVKGSLGLVTGLFQALLSFVFILFSLFFLLRDADKFEGALRGVLPLEPAECDRLIHRTVEVVHASVFGVIAIASLQGFLGGLTFALLGLSSPVLWGVVMALFAMVPMVGAGAVWLPAAIFLLIVGETSQAVILILVGALLIGTIDNFLRPRLVGGRTGLHELVVFFAVLGGLKFFGLVGLLIGPAVLAVAWSMLELFRMRGENGSAAPIGGAPTGGSEGSAH